MKLAALALAAALPHGWLVVGDCIAVGFGQHCAGCTVSAAVGRTAGQVAANVPSGCYPVAVISAGSNNPGRHLPAELERIRARVCAGRVVWIVPRPARAARAVRAEARCRGDTALAFAPGRDGIHPRSYGRLARRAAALVNREVGR